MDLDENWTPDFRQLLEDLSSGKYVTTEQCLDVIGEAVAREVALTAPPSLASSEERDSAREESRSAVPDRGIEAVSSPSCYTENRHYRHLPPPSRSDDAIVVFGPTRGHAADLAHVLLTRVCTPRKKSFVFLGNYVDGGPSSLEVLCIVATLQRQLGSDRVVLLRGAHEYLYPDFPVAWAGADTAMLRSEVNVRGNDLLSRLVLRWFRLLPLFCLVHHKFLCVPSGISHHCPSIPAMKALLSPSAAESSSLGSPPRLLSSSTDAPVIRAVKRHLVLNAPMDDDDEYTLPQDVHYAASEEYPDSYLYSFQAVCNFLRKSQMAVDKKKAPCEHNTEAGSATESPQWLSILRGNHFTTDRTSSADCNRFGRPYFYQHSPCDPGYRLHRAHPTTGVPTVVTLFSAPEFCGLNRNLGAFALVEPQSHSLSIAQFGPSPRRGLQLPGTHRNAFSWSVPLLWRLAANAANDMLRAADTSTDFLPPVGEGNDRTAAAEDEREHDALLDRFGHFAALCLYHGYPLPDLSGRTADEPELVKQ